LQKYRKFNQINPNSRFKNLEYIFKTCQNEQNISEMCKYNHKLFKKLMLSRNVMFCGKLGMLFFLFFQSFLRYIAYTGRKEDFFNEFTTLE